MIKVDNVVKFYGEYQALKGLSFSIDTGEIVGFLGPNGAGKTTMMRIITGYLPATSGNVYVDNFEVYEDPISVKKRIGYMPENISLYEEMTVADYLGFSASLKGIEKKLRKEAIDRAIEKTNLEKYKNRLIGHLSKGYRQRTGLAQAIINNPAVLILDEPTSGLDPKQLIEIRTLIKNLGGEHTVILSTHILSEVEDVCKRALIIDQGTLIASDTIEGLKHTVDSEVLGGNVILKVAENTENAVVTVRGVDGVVQAYIDIFNNIVVECSRGFDIRADIAKRLVDENFRLLEIKTMDRTLEEVFVYLTEKTKNKEENTL